MILYLKMSNSYFTCYVYFSDSDVMQKMNDIHVFNLLPITSDCGVIHKNFSGFEVANKNEYLVLHYYIQCTQNEQVIFYSFDICSDRNVTESE